MPFYSEELIEEVRSRNDIVDVISQYVKLQKKGSTWFGLCPFHNEKTPSFSVSRNKQMFYCFGCGAGGNVITFEMKYQNAGFPEALQMLADRAGMELPRQEMSAKAKQRMNRRQKLLDINREAARFYYRKLHTGPGERALAYFHDRGLTDETIRRFGLGCSGTYSNELYTYLKQKGYPDELLKDSGLISYREDRGGYDRFWNRAMFPIMDASSKVIGFGGRVMGDAEPKYLNSPETLIFDKSRNLYGLNYARASRKDYMLLCEGYMDVIALHQAGFDNAVASLGTSLTSGHASLLSRYTREVCLTYDSDGAGIKAALRAIPILKQAGITAKVVDLKPYKDPDEFIRGLGAEAYQERIDHAENSFLYEIRMMEREYDLKDPEDKTRFHRGIARKILEFPQEQERENYIEAVAEKYQMGFENLRALVREEGTRGGIAAVPRQKLKSGIRRKEKEDGILMSQKLMLTWLVEDESLFEVTAPYIGPEDFTDEILHEVAVELYAQHQQGTLNPAKIISRFEDEEQQKKAASVFHARLVSLESEAEWNKAVQDTVLRIKQNSIDTRLRNGQHQDLARMQQIMEEQKLLKQIREKKVWPRAKRQ
jgi:DNA primase